MRWMFALLLALTLTGITTISYACPQGYVDCGRGVCCPQ
jgi:hypothetical protein